MGRQRIGPLARFFGHTLAATGIFFCIFVAAGVIDFSVHLVHGRISGWLEYVADGVAALIVVLDVIAFVRFLVKQFWILMKEI